jgi:hypothetical protein
MAELENRLEKPRMGMLLIPKMRLTQALFPLPDLPLFCDRHSTVAAGHISRGSQCGPGIASVLDALRAKIAAASERNLQGRHSLQVVRSAVGIRDRWSGGDSGETGSQVRRAVDERGRCPVICA